MKLIVQPEDGIRPLVDGSFFAVEEHVAAHGIGWQT